MDVYFSTKEFLTNQIRLLNAQFRREDLEDVVDLENEDDEIPEQTIVKLLAKVNQKKRAYYSKVFTQQAIKHVVMQVQDSMSQRSVEARKELESERNQSFIATDPSIAQYADGRIDALPQHELVSLTESLILMHDSEAVNNLKQSLGTYRAAVERNESQQYLSRQLTETFTDSPQEHVQKNLITSQSPILDELARLRTLCAKLQAKALANPEQFKQAINE